MKNLGLVFSIVRGLLTIIGLLPLGMVLLMITYAVVVEGDRFTDTGANIGLGLLMLVVLANLPVWLLWLFPPYPRWLGGGGRDGPGGEN